MNDLDIIKDNYGEKMMYLCREMFDSLLEVSNLMLEHFAPNKTLYDDLIECNALEAFYNYISSLIEGTNISLDELLNNANYVCVDGKYYKYNINNDTIGVYYCPNNIIIDNGKVIEQYAKEPERYILIDYFIIDLYDKKIYCYKDCDPFGYEFRTNSHDKFDIDEIVVSEDSKTGNRILEIIYKNEVISKITIDKLNRMKELYNKKIVKMPMGYLYRAKYLEVIDLPNLERMSCNCFEHTESLIRFEAKKLKDIGWGYFEDTTNSVEYIIIGADLILNPNFINQGLEKNKKEDGTYEYIKKKEQEVIDDSSKIRSKDCKKRKRRRLI